MTRTLFDRYHEALRASGITPPQDPPVSVDDCPRTGATAPPERPRDCATVFADVDAYLVESRLLGEAVWLAPDNATAERLERELTAESDHRLVFTVAEVLVLRDMLEADRRTSLRALATIKCGFGSATLSSVGRADETPE